MKTGIKPTKRPCPLQHTDGSKGKIIRETVFIQSVPSEFIAIGSKIPGTYEHRYSCDTCGAVFNYSPNDDEKAEDAENEKKWISIDRDDDCL